MKKPCQLRSVNTGELSLPLFPRLRISFWAWADMRVKIRMRYRMSLIYGHRVIAATSALRFADHVIKKQRLWGREWRRHCRSGVTDCSEEKLLQCLIRVWLQIAMDQSKVSLYLCTTYLSLTIKRRFRQNRTDQVRTDSSSNFSGICLDENW